MPTKRTDGRLVQTIVDPITGKKKYFYGATKAEINRKILEYREKTAGCVLFSAVADAWWKEAKENLAAQSIKPYLPALKRAVEAFGDILIRDITPRMISSFLAKFAATGKSQKTVATQRIILNLIFKHAMEEGLIEINPVASVRSQKGLKKAKRTAASKTDEEIIRSSADVWLFPFFALHTGMRKGEILALQWQDIDFERELIRVAKSVQHIGNAPSIKRPKTEAGVRVVPILPPLMEELLKRRGDPETFLFSVDGKGPLEIGQYNTLMRRYRKATGITASAHQLRHSFATLAFEADVPAKALQEIIGHKQLSTTMDIYTEFREQSIRTAADLLKAKLSKP